MQAKKLAVCLRAAITYKGRFLPMLFAALRFFKDENLADRLYWYRSDFTVKEGDKVFAPVGARDRVQKAIVERVVCAEEANAPYDIALIKRLCALCGAESFEIGSLRVRDLGGVAFDERHYTRFSRLAFCEHIQPLTAEERALVRRAGYDGVIEEGEGLEAVSSCSRILIVGQNAREIARKIISAARGGAEEESIAALARRLT
ncbi:MAG: hypothetical protein HFE28_04075 [Clostridia bacterium]|jgi:hypothetical protein|nr:hypothetical protein [Clostridia bacterium]